MKKKIIIGSVLAAFIMIMLPSINAVENNTKEIINEPNPIQKIIEI